MALARRHQQKDCDGEALTIKLDGLAAVLLFALVGAVLWMLRQNSGSVVVVPSWVDEDLETEDLPTWDDLT